MKIIVLKIGGSCLTYKREGIGKIRKNFLNSLVREFNNSWKKKKFSLIIIHGGGSITHPLVDKYKLSQKLKTGIISSNREKLAVSKIHFAMNMLNKKVAQAFLDGKIPVWPMQTSALFSFFERKLIDKNLKNIKLALKNGFIPILHGDVALDEKTGAVICSGDLVAAIIAKELGAQKLLFASDVDGIFYSDPSLKKSAKIIKKLDINFNLPGELNWPKDHSGGMVAKLSYIRKNCRQMKVVIFNGLKKGNFEKTFLDDDIGTTIFC